jgi:sphingolipid delta-4 desaturase
MAYHVPRRTRILKEHPEIKELYGAAPGLKYVTAAEVAAMWGIAYVCKPLLISYPIIWALLAYSIGGILAGSLTLAMHELAHGHGFDKGDVPFGLHDVANRVVGYVADVGMMLPVSASFRRYHLEHHAYMADQVIDADLPSEWECKTFVGPLGKLLWLILMPVFYGLRPMVVRPLPPTIWEGLGWLNIISAHVVAYTQLGWEVNAFIILSSLSGVSLHPISGHFIAEHYVFPGKPVENETHSYYGFWNYFTFNVGYHTEHHDFPKVSYHKLHKLYEMAYKNDATVSVLESWTGCQWDFVFNDSCSLRERVVRCNETKKVIAPPSHPALSSKKGN